MHQQQCGGVAQTPEFQITWDGGQMVMGGMTKGKNLMEGKWQKWYGGEWLWGGNDKTDTQMIEC